MAYESVNHPQHYGGDTVYEVIKVLDAWGLGFALGNAVKCIARAGSKPSADNVEDLRKARWCIDHEIKRLEGEPVVSVDGSTAPAPTPTRTALQIAADYGDVDGDHHKAWVIDQMIRALTGVDYESWVVNHGHGDWDEGVAP